MLACHEACALLHTAHIHLNWNNGNINCWRSFSMFLRRLYLDSIFDVYCFFLFFSPSITTCTSSIYASKYCLPSWTMCRVCFLWFSFSICTRLGCWDWDWFTCGAIDSQNNGNKIEFSLLSVDDVGRCAMMLHSPRELLIFYKRFADFRNLSTLARWCGGLIHFIQNNYVEVQGIIVAAMDLHLRVSVTRARVCSKITRFFAKSNRIRY